MLYWRADFHCILSKSSIVINLEKANSKELKNESFLYLKTVKFKTENILKRLFKSQWFSRRTTEEEQMKYLPDLKHLLKLQNEIQNLPNEDMFRENL